ncbi:MAG: hypothetical protein ABL903_04205 [Methylococcales bacterium]
MGQIVTYSNAFEHTPDGVNKKVFLNSPGDGGQGVTLGLDPRHFEISFSNPVKFLYFTCRNDGYGGKVSVKGKAALDGMKELDIADLRDHFFIKGQQDSWRLKFLEPRTGKLEIQTTGGGNEFQIFQIYGVA